MATSVHALATPRNVSVRAQRPTVERSNSSDPEPALQHILYSGEFDLDLRPDVSAVLRELERPPRRRRCLESQSLPSDLPGDDELNAMLTQTRALLLLYEEFGRLLASLDVSASDQPPHT
jgi:hypothetical protein